MTDIVQLIYASRATFEPARYGGIEPAVGRILTQSRHNNAKRQIGGALYYSNGYFLQCLEGERSVVNHCYQQIKADPRHSDLKVLLERTVSERIFGNWSMKYVASQDDIELLLRKYGHNEFNPYNLDTQIIDAILQLFTQTVDPTRGAATVRTGVLASPYFVVSISIVILLMLLISLWIWL